MAIDGCYCTAQYWYDVIRSPDGRLRRQYVRQASSSYDANAAHHISWQYRTSPASTQHNPQWLNLTIGSREYQDN